MENHPERRDSRRIIVGSDYTIRFVAKGRSFQNVRITNLSAGGCFAIVGHGDAGFFSHGTILEQLTIEHPRLKVEGLTAEVRYVLGGSSTTADAMLDFTGIGIRFISTPTESQKNLNTFVTRFADLLGA